MLHYSLTSGGLNPITDDKGVTGVSIFFDKTFDTTVGGAGSTHDVLIYVFNNDTNFKYTSPTISLSGSDAVLTKSMFRFLDNQYISGAVPTAAEWTTYGVIGTSTMLIDTIGKVGSVEPLEPVERKIWLQCNIPAGLLTANLVGLKLKVESVEEGV